MDARERREFASEIKFLIPLAQAGAIREWARERLAPDPYGGGPAGDVYQIASLYLDTPQFEVLRRVGSFGRSKYRIRRYGQAEHVFLERKLKVRQLVSKRRSMVGAAELHRLAEAEPQSGWAGFRFHRRILGRHLQVVCQVSYARTARVCVDGARPIRLTLDENLRAVSARTPEFQDPLGLSLFDGHAILELKYRCTLPSAFEELIEKFSLIPRPVSKYRTAVAALAPRSEGSFNQTGASALG